MRKIRVYLRSLEPSDAHTMYCWRSDESVGKFYSGTRKYTSEYAELKWLNERALNIDTVNCAICLKETNEFIGCVFLDSIDWINRSGHCPIFIGAKEQMGKGYATEGRILMLKHAFYDKGLERIWAHVVENNMNSLKMLNNNGFKKEGILRNASYMDGKFYNIIVMSLLRNEFDEILCQYEI